MKQSNTNSNNQVIQPSHVLMVVGNGACGKTNFLHRWFEDTYNPYKEATLETAFFKKMIQFQQQNKKQLISIWDTNGHKKYRSLLNILVKKTQGIFILLDLQQLLPLMCDLSQNQEFSKKLQEQMIKPFVQIVQNCRNSEQPIIYYFLISKIDLVSKEQRDLITYQIKMSVEQILKKLQMASSYNKTDSINTSQCTTLYSFISSKEQNQQDLNLIVKRMIYFIELQNNFNNFNSMVRNMQNWQINSLESMLFQKQRFGSVFKQKLKKYSQTAQNGGKKNDYKGQKQNYREGRISLDYRASLPSQYRKKKCC